MTFTIDVGQLTFASPGFWVIYLGLTYFLGWLMVRRTYHMRDKFVQMAGFDLGEPQTAAGMALLTAPIWTLWPLMLFICTIPFMVLGWLCKTKKPDS